MSNSSSSSMTSSTMSSESAPMSSMNAVFRVTVSLFTARCSQTISITRCSTDTVHPPGGGNDRDRRNPRLRPAAMAPGTLYKFDPDQPLGPDGVLHGGRNYPNKTLLTGQEKGKIDPRPVFSCQTEITGKKR